jgi:hypothetical protein
VFCSMARHHIQAGATVAVRYLDGGVYEAAVYPSARYQTLRKNCVQHGTTVGSAGSLAGSFRPETSTGKTRSARPAWRVFLHSGFVRHRTDDGSAAIYY